MTSKDDREEEARRIKLSHELWSGCIPAASLRAGQGHAPAHGAGPINMAFRGTVDSS